MEGVEKEMNVVFVGLVGGKGGVDWLVGHRVGALCRDCGPFFSLTCSAARRPCRSETPPAAWPPCSTAAWPPPVLMHRRVHKEGMCKHDLHLFGGGGRMCGMMGMGEICKHSCHHRRPTRPSKSPSPQNPNQASPHIHTLMPACTAARWQRTQRGPTPTCAPPQSRASGRSRPPVCVVGFVGVVV